MIGASVTVFAQGGAGGEEEPERGLVAVVTDIGGLNDRSFNHLANVGRLMAEKQAAVQTRIYVDESAAQRVNNLRRPPRARGTAS